MLLCGGNVKVFPQEIVASKTVYPVNGGTSCLHNQGTCLLSYVASHATTSQCWVTTARNTNLSKNYVTLCKIYKAHYEIWGIICEVLTVLLTDGNSSLLRCDIVKCQYAAGPWCYHCEGRGVQVESSTLKTKGLQLLKISATAHTMTQHHMWHYIPADHNLDTKHVLLLTLWLTWGFWFAELTNSIIDPLLFPPTYCPLLHGLRGY